MSHGSGLYIPPYVLRGARQVIPESAAFEPDEFLDLCEHHPGCSAFLAPTMVQRLVATGRPRPRNLRTIVYGGGPMYVDSLKKAMAAFGPIFVQLYGQGEAPMTITGLRRADHVRCRRRDPRLGRLRALRRRRRGAARRRHAAPASARSARSSAAATSSCPATGTTPRPPPRPCRTAGCTPATWARSTTRGYLTLRDRSKDVVISGGSNIYPREVEEVLLEHPDVAEAVRRRRARTRSGARSSSRSSSVRAEPADLDAHLLERIARFKRPKRYEFVDELPKNSYGKVLKRELRERLS